MLLTVIRKSKQRYGMAETALSSHIQIQRTEHNMYIKLTCLFLCDKYQSYFIIFQYLKYKIEEQEMQR